MVRHLFIAALRNMAANRLLSAIAILGLAVGFTGAILMALVIRSQLTYDDFIPGHERLYLAITDVREPGAKPWIIDRTHRLIAGRLTLNIPEIEGATRLMVTDQLNGGDVAFKRGNILAGEKIYWADPNAFDVLPLPALHGDLSTALRHPDGVVLPRAAARKYFGHDNPVGQAIELNGHSMTVRAVIEDIPANRTNLESGIFASNLAPFLGFTAYKPSPPGQFSPEDLSTRTYFRLRPGASLEQVQAQSAKLVEPIYPPKMHITMPLVRVDRIHLMEDLGSGLVAGTNAGIMASLAVAGVVGLLVLFIASVNFVNLTLARAARREVEIGTRKVCGAGRRDLILQFLGEALIAAGLAGLLALALSEWLLPSVNAFLDTGARFDFAGDPLLLPAIILAVAAVGLAAGAYPAFVLSGFKPATLLRGWTSNLADAGLVRHGLVVVQFAILVVLAIAAGVVWQQWNYAMNDALRVETDQMLVLNIPGPHIGCPAAFTNEVRGLAGVNGAGCTGPEFLEGPLERRYPDRNGILHSFDLARIETDILRLYGVKPVAGQLAPLVFSESNRTTVISESAARMLGFASAQAAIGQNLPSTPTGAMVARIIAVVPDFNLYPVSHPATPTLFAGFAKQGIPGSLLHIRLRGSQIPETLAAIDRLWNATGQTGAVTRFFLDDHMQQRYLAMLRQAQLFAVCAGLAILLPCLGLVGISISAAERRTREIGLRKAMGAVSLQIFALMLFQFSKPVLWANLIAWPLAWWLMQRWLSGFSTHVPLSWWLFPAAGVATLLIALSTVAGQAWLVARQKPVLALR